MVTTVSEDLPAGVLGIESTSYRGKYYRMPVFDAAGPVVVVPQGVASDVMRSGAVPHDDDVPTGAESPVMRCLNTVWDLREFQIPRRPVSLGVLRPDELAAFSLPGAVRVLDMPVKMPDCAEYRLPRALAQFAPVIRRIADFEHRVNPHHAEYHAYLTVDQRRVDPGTLHREAPCHVDGFQGARWQPKCRTNHTYTVSDSLPTSYYVQPFDLTGLDEAVHDFFWEMNAQVADTREAHRWRPAEAELTLMGCYSVHRGTENGTGTPVFRTWLRLSFEERRRVFDRLGNAHNPLFDYRWTMVDRDIEQLGLRAFRTDGDPSLRVFPWQDERGEPLPPGAPKTKPRLQP